MQRGALESQYSVIGPKYNTSGTTEAKRYAVLESQYSVCGPM